MKELYSSKLCRSNNFNNLIYTASSDVIIHSLYICNIGIDNVNITLRFKSQGQNINLFKNIFLPLNTTYTLEKAINLCQGDELYVDCNIQNSLDVVISELFVIQMGTELYSNTFKSLTNIPQLIYANNEDIRSNIYSFYICNNNLTLSSRVNIWIEDDNQNIFYILKNSEVVSNIIWNKSINLISSQKIVGSISNSSDNDIDIFLSILQLE
jgi:hypothetical protein